MAEQVASSSLSEETKPWPEPALATLYRATVSFGTQEQQLIWTRYAAFLVLNGFIISAYTKLWTSPPSVIPYIEWVFLGLGLIGLFINAIWHILNFSGWHNQNYWFYLATNLSERLNEFTLPTDPFKKRVPRPFGLIYWLAQTIPVGLSLANTAAGSLGLTKLGFSWLNCLMAGGVFWIAIALCIFRIEYIALAPPSSGTKERPL